MRREDGGWGEGKGGVGAAIFEPSPTLVNAHWKSFSVDPPKRQGGSTQLLVMYV